MKTVLVMIAMLNGTPAEFPVRDYGHDQAASCVADMHAAWKAGFDSACIDAANLRSPETSIACHIANIAPTDSNIEACTGEPIELSSAPPKLVGYGCEGESGPIYGMAEDEFPVCRDIRRVD